MKTRICALALLIITTAVGTSAAQQLPKSDRSPPINEGAEVFRYQNPAIQNYGRVVQLPDATQQPRAGSKIAVDITKGGPADKLNPALNSVARFVNIYQGAGKKPAKVDIAIVLHGSATLVVLNDTAYAKRFKTQGNPNLKCLQALHDSGVKIFVCGQSLIGSGSKPEEVTSLSNVAVSALTSLVNLQMDGYAFVPIGN